MLARADQALQILERYKARLDAVSSSLSALEVEDLVTVRDVATVLQRAEMVRRIAEEIEGYVIELGADGRLVLLQLEELMGGVEDDRRLVAKDYFTEAPDWELLDVMHRLAELDTESLLDLREVAGGAPPPRRHRASTTPSSRVASGSCTRSRASPKSSPTTSSTGSRTCRRSCAPACPTWSRSRASARLAPAPSRKASRAWPRPRSSNATCDAGARTKGRARRGSSASRSTATAALRSRRSTPRPTARPVAGLVLHPDIMGVRPLFDDLCRRLATHGLAVCAPEPFARLPENERAGLDAMGRMEQVKDLDDDAQLGDLAARRRAACALPTASSTVAVLGFCMGGMYTLKAAGIGAFDRAVPFYGMIRVPEAWRGDGPARAARLRAPTPARRSRSSAMRTRGRRAADIDALRERVGGQAPTTRSSCTPAPTTASCTTPTAPPTAPTTPPTPGAAPWLRARPRLIELARVGALRLGARRAGTSELEVCPIF